MSFRSWCHYRFTKLYTAHMVEYDSQVANWFIIVPNLARSYRVAPLQL